MYMYLQESKQESSIKRNGILHMPPSLFERAFSCQMKSIFSVANDVATEEMSNPTQSQHELMMEEDPFKASSMKDAVRCCFIRWNMDDTRPSVQDWCGTGYIHWQWIYNECKQTCNEAKMTKEDYETWLKMQTEGRKYKKSSKYCHGGCCRWIGKHNIYIYDINIWFVMGTAKHNTVRTC